MGWWPVSRGLWTLAPGTPRGRTQHPGAARASRGGGRGGVPGLLGPPGARTVTAGRTATRPRRAPLTAHLGGAGAVAPIAPPRRLRISRAPARRPPGRPLSPPARRR